METIFWMLATFVQISFSDGLSLQRVLLVREKIGYAFFSQKSVEWSWFQMIGKVFEILIVRVNFISGFDGWGKAEESYKNKPIVAHFASMTS